MSLLRKKLIYENCKVFSPDGILMFRCEEKRIHWYLSRNLAELIDSRPLSIKLKFIPKGLGANREMLKVERKNLCVICGCEDLSALTKHHIVPQAFRKNFPKEKKENNSILIVPLCRQCHSNYEKLHALSFKQEICKKYNIKIEPPELPTNPETKAIKIIDSLKNHKIGFPSKGLTKLQKTLFSILSKLKLINNFEELFQQGFLEETKNQLKKIYSEASNGCQQSAKTLFQNKEVLEAFEK
jgi:hypothetical protein